MARRLWLGGDCAGPQGQCYVQFVDGQTAWQAPDSFTEAIHARDARVQEVALGQWGTWVITFEDGTTSWCGVPEVRLPMPQCAAPPPLTQNIASAAPYLHYIPPAATHRLPTYLPLPSQNKNTCHV
jgi:hypothetical protein